MLGLTQGEEYNGRFSLLKAGLQRLCSSCKQEVMVKFSTPCFPMMQRVLTLSMAGKKIHKMLEWLASLWVDVQQKILSPNGAKKYCKSYTFSDLWLLDIPRAYSERTNSNSLCSKESLSLIQIILLSKWAAQSKKKKRKNRKNKKHLPPPPLHTQKHKHKGFLCGSFS